MLTEEEKELIADKTKVVRYYYSLLDNLANMPLEQYREIKSYIISIYGEAGFRAIAKKAVAEYRKDE